MSPRNKQVPNVSPLVVTLFIPARWCRRQWPHIWFKLAVAGILSVGLLSLFGTWSGFAGQRSWDNWLANLQFSGSGTRRPKAQSKSKLEFSDKEPLPAYLGDGKAELGDYSIRVFDPITRSVLRTDFRLEGSTSLGDEASFQQFMRCNRRFFREQVAVVFRSHNLDDLASPDLKLLGRKIVARVNRSLGERMLKSAEIKDFSLYESMDHSGFVPWEAEAGDGDGVP